MLRCILQSQIQIQIQSQVLLLTPSHQQENWESTHLGYLSPAYQRDTLYRMMSCSVERVGGRRSRGRVWDVFCGGKTFRVMVFIITVTRGGALSSWRWLNTCLVIRRSKLISCFICLDFALLIKLSLFKPINVLIIDLLILS